MKTLNGRCPVPNKDKTALIMFNDGHIMPIKIKKYKSTGQQDIYDEVLISFEDEDYECSIADPILHDQRWYGPGPHPNGWYKCIVEEEVYEDADYHWTMANAFAINLLED